MPAETPDPAQAASVRLLGPADVRSLAAALDLRPTKQRGQNFVIDANTVRRIVRDAGLTGDDVVVEVGPGLGSLTLALLEVVDRVVAIELDQALAAALPATVADRAPGRAAALEVVAADALRIGEVPGPPPTALVANLPYNVSVPVLLHLLTLLPSLEKGLVMVQAEVADRLAALPGSKVYGVPSVKAAWFAEVRRAGAVGRNVFWPAPNVDSGLVAWTRRDPPATTASREQVFAVVDAAFAQRRKTLRSTLKGLAGSGEAAEAALRAAGVDPTARGEVLDVQEFARIAEALVERGTFTAGQRASARRSPRAGKSVTVRAPAKINLHLGVGPVREDGFHPLATAYQAISLFSTVTATDAEDWALTCTGRDGVDVADVPLDGTNLALRATRLLARHAGVDRPVALHLDKGIPVAGGLAGGSADAAATLLACDTLWGLGTPREKLLELAAELGSDVPFALVGGSAAGHGRGELVSPLADTGRYDWVVLTHRFGVSTPASYAEFDALHAGAQVPDPEIPRELVEALAAGDVRRLAGALGNDLQPASLRLRPELAEPLQAGLDASALAALISGSGPTCLFLCEDADHAARVAGALSSYGRTTLARGPVPGAQVV